MTKREAAILGLLGFGVWLSGAIGITFGGRLMFENGPLVLAAVTAGVAASVCFLLKAIMDWRKLPAGQSGQAAAALAWPGLLADAAYSHWFSAITGLDPATAGAFGTVIMAGNGALLAYAVWRMTRA